ncbi:hypothetical protein LSH36_84g03028 [Paralvinella palmiformis]|uniref:Uncharacterized protein n=1 Tax=Paralvinella palmiformis TaxID=53620 RepID=A0AAD9NDG3_9ANNE|nr:hypothetical protein LSH36_84g03028 [Paralvinella palmiformis]
MAHIYGECLILMGVQMLCVVIRTEGMDTVAHSDMMAGINNVSETINKILDEYDIRLRPQFGG